MKDLLKLILFFEYFLLPNSYIVLNKAYFTIVTFLTYSEAKLEELSAKNQQLKTELPRKEEVKKQA